MSLRKPPALADWLLNRLRLPDSNPPLAGDLLEEFQSGRSRAWYWRQTIKAITTGLRSNARASRIRLNWILVVWAFQVGIAFTLWRLKLPAQLPSRFHGSSILIALCVTLIVVFALGDSAKKKTIAALSRLGFWFIVPLFDAVWFVVRFDINDRERACTVLIPIVKAIAYLGFYCLAAVCVPLKLSDMVLFECYLLASDVIPIILHPPDGKAA